MQPTPPAIPRKARRWIWIPLVAAALLAGLVGVFIFQAREHRRQAQAAIDAGLDRIRTAGEPVTAQDLAKLYPSPPPEHDAAILLAPALAALSIPADADDLPFFSSAPLPPTEQIREKLRSRMDALLSANDRALKLVPWARLENSWIGSGYEQGLTNRVYDTGRLLKLSRLCFLSAIVAAEDGNLSNAVHQIRNGLALGETLRSRIMIHFMVHRMIQKRACETLEWVVNRSNVAPTNLKILETLLAENEDGQIRDVFLDDRCRVIRMLKTLQTTTEAAVGDNSNHTWYRGMAFQRAYFTKLFLRLSGRIYRDEDFIRFLDQSSHVFDVLKLPPRQELPDINKMVDEYTKKMDSASFSQGISDAFFSRFGLVAYDVEIRARLRTALAALTIESWRSIHEGNFPDSLAQLPAEERNKIPVDPFDLQPLRYKRLEKGFVVYSVGPDFSDDGGKQKADDAKETDHYDITFSVLR
ncbi:hypothetical protein GC207_00310 [bacterium]|nr:hypothetical protein [bacterium]